MPANSPMNPPESATAKSKVLLQLAQRELMKSLGIDSERTFLVICQNLERHNFIVVSAPALGWEPIVTVTELGAAAVRECLRG